MKTLILLLTLLVAGCGEDDGRRNKVAQIVIEFDGCEYIEVQSRVAYGYTVYSLTHKGNCKNKEHRP